MSTLTRSKRQNVSAGKSNCLLWRCYTCLHVIFFIIIIHLLPKFNWNDNNEVIVNKISVTLWFFLDISLKPLYSCTTLIKSRKLYWSTDYGGYGYFSSYTWVIFWYLSSSSRASDLHSEGTGIDTRVLHIILC